MTDTTTDKRVSEFFKSGNWQKNQYCIIDRWNELIENKYAFVDDRDTVSLEMFGGLVEETYDFVEELFFACIHLTEETAAENRRRPTDDPAVYFVSLKEDLLQTYARIITCVRAFSIMDCYTSNLNYKAAVAVARFLYYKLNGFYSTHKGPILSMTLDDGDFWLDRRYTKKERYREYLYDIRKRDFTQMLSYAKKIN